MRTHVTVIAWLNIIYNGLGLLAGLGIFLFFTFLGGAAAATGGKEALPALPLLGGLGSLAFFFIALLSIPGLILAWGLLHYAPWARILGIVVSIFELVSFHSWGIGTLIGIYTLVILFNPETVRLFEGRSSSY